MARLDRDRFEQLVSEHHAAVYRSAQRVLRHASDAADTAQDVFLRALAGKVPLTPGAERAALCWLSTRLALNALRGARRRHRKETTAVMQNEPISPLQHATDTELRQSVRRLVDGLPEDLRLPLVLHYQDELTYAAVGTALAISQSTAHERVQSALARLRQQLGRLGLAAIPGLPELVAAAEPLGAPPGLETRLMSLGAATSFVAPTLVKLAALAVLLTGATWATIAFTRDYEPGSDPVVQPVALAPLAPRAGDAEVRGPDARGPDAVRAAVLPGVTDSAVAAPAQDPVLRTYAAFTGTVHDAESWPVGNARVVAVAAGGLKPFELVATTTDARGAFRLEVPFEARPVPATKIRIQVLAQVNLLMQTGELAVPRDADPEPLRLLLPASAGTETSRFVLAVTVRSSSGEVLAGVPVALLVQGDPPPRPGQTRPEVEATTGADGVVRLAGRTAGAKLLFADGRKLGLRAAFAKLSIDRPGEQSAALELTPGHALRGHVKALDGTPLEWANVWLEDEATRLYHTSKLGPQGEIEFTCLGDGPFTLRVDRHPFSPAAVRGVRPGDSPVAVQLKRHDDLRDVGQHMAELHGRLVDAETGAVVAFTSEQVEGRRVLAGESTLAADRLEAPRQAQRMVDRVERREFHLTGLEPGSWAVRASVPGYAGAVHIVELRAGELRAGVDLRLQRGAEVSGRIVGGDGCPVGGAFVFVTGLGARADASIAAWDAARQKDEARGAAPAALACSVRAGADGAFTLPGVPPGERLRVVAVAAGHAPAETASLVLRPGERHDCQELRLRAR